MWNKDNPAKGLEQQMSYEKLTINSESNIYVQ
jgi:hypothetical protein